MKFAFRAWVVCVAGCMCAAPLLSAPPRDVVPVGYTGRVWYADGCGCEPVWGPCWDPCRPHCGLGLVPAVVRGVDRILHGLFAGVRCYDPCGWPCGVPGCSDCYGSEALPDGVPVPEPMTSEPRMGRMYIPRTVPGHGIDEEIWSDSPPVYRQSGYRNVPPARSTPQPSLATSRPRSVQATSAEKPERDELRPAGRAIELQPIDQPLRRASYETNSSKKLPVSSAAVPHNPLRD